MGDYHLCVGAVLAGLHQGGDGPVGLTHAPGLIRHMNGALGCGVRNDVDAQGAEQRAHNGPHPAIFDEVVEIFQGEAGPQGGLIAVELLAESVEVPIIPRCLHQGLGPADQQHHGPGGGAGVDDADLLFRVLLQHHLPGDAGRVIRAGELGGKREADGTVPPLKGPGKVGGGGAGGRGGSLLHRHGGEQGGNRQGVIVHKFPAAHLDAQRHGLKPDAAAVEGSCPQVAAAVAHNIPCHKEHPEI